jgi:hypothetical protein
MVVGGGWVQVRGVVGRGGGEGLLREVENLSDSITEGGEGGQ